MRSAPSGSLADLVDVGGRGQVRDGVARVAAQRSGASVSLRSPTTVSTSGVPGRRREVVDDRLMAGARERVDDM